ncbi:unnamed protein product [Rhizoctonia solani]|uniref:Uncharacterized protein n=1 Tax=Rhizoctonia solani TaxID=456999 RepID=A0A8H3HRS8_9AGAM|nr:unnamed protein product [Rhizoctonia solani]
MLEALRLRLHYSRSFQQVRCSSLQNDGHQHAGTIFIDLELEKFLRKKLEGAGLNPDDVAEYAKAGVKDYDSLAKQAFTDETTDQWIQIAPTRLNNASIGVRRGGMTIPG